MSNSRTKYATTGVRFKSTGKHRGSGHESCKMNSTITLLSLYQGCRTSRIRIKNIPPNVEVACTVTTRINFIQSSRETLNKRKGQTLENLAQATSNVFEWLRENIHLCEETVLSVNFEGKRRLCFKCGKKLHHKFKYSPPQEERNWKQNH